MNAFDVVNYFRGGEERGKARKRKGKGKRKQTKPNSSQTSNQSNSVLKKTIIMTSIVEVSLAVSKRVVRRLQCPNSTFFFTSRSSSQRAESLPTIPDSSSLKFRMVSFVPLNYFYHWMNYRGMCICAVFRFMSTWSLINSANSMLQSNN